MKPVSFSSFCSRLLSNYDVYCRILTRCSKETKVKSNKKGLNHTVQRESTTKENQDGSVPVKMTAMDVGSRNPRREKVAEGVANEGCVKGKRPKATADFIETGMESADSEVYVNNFPNGTTAEWVRNMMGSYGEVVSASVRKRPNRRGLLFGFVKFKSKDSALQMIDSLNGFKFNGHTLFAAIARPGKRKNRLSATQSSPVQTCVKQGTTITSGKKAMQDSEPIPLQNIFHTINLHLRQDKNNEQVDFLPEVHAGVSELRVEKLQPNIAGNQTNNRDPRDCDFNSAINLEPNPTIPGCASMERKSMIALNAICDDSGDSVTRNRESYGEGGLLNGELGPVADLDHNGPVKAGCIKPVSPQPVMRTQELEFAFGPESGTLSWPASNDQELGSNVVAQLVTHKPLVAGHKFGSNPGDDRVDEPAQEGGELTHPNPSLIDVGGQVGDRKDNTWKDILLSPPKLVVTKTKGTRGKKHSQGCTYSIQTRTKTQSEQERLAAQRRKEIWRQFVTIGKLATE